MTLLRPFENSTRYMLGDHNLTDHSNMSKWHCVTLWARCSQGSCWRTRTWPSVKWPQSIEHSKKGLKVKAEDLSQWPRQTDMQTDLILASWIYLLSSSGDPSIHSATSLHGVGSEPPQSTRPELMRSTQILGKPAVSIASKKEREKMFAFVFLSPNKK